MEVEIKLSVLHEKQQEIIDTKKRFNILKCGRRFGKTELMQDIAINTALDGFPAGYWSPTYKDLHEVWNSVKRLCAEITLKKDEQVKQIELVTGGKIDFWSMENPDSGKGRKYKTAIVDEAEKAGKLKEAIRGTIMPTLVDYSGDLWVVSSPKFGRTDFKEMFEDAKKDENWQTWRFTTYDNPHIKHSEIELQKSILPKPYFDCEFLAVDVDVVAMPFAYNFDPLKHVSPVGLDFKTGIPKRFGQDFNVDPMANICCQMWFDAEGHHIWFLRELALFNSGTEEMIKVLKSTYSQQDHANSLWTGDATSRKRTAEQSIKGTQHLTSWIKIDHAFSLGKRLQTPKANPHVESTRELLNTILALHPDIRFDPSMQRTIRELKYTESTGDGGILKGDREDDAKRADFIDVIRYILWTWCGDFETNMKKYGVK